MSVIETAKKVLQQEAEAVLSLQEKLDNNFEKAVDYFFSWSCCINRYGQIRTYC